MIGSEAVMRRLLTLVCVFFMMTPPPALDAATARRAIDFLAQNVGMP